MSQHKKIDEVLKNSSGSSNARYGACSFSVINKLTKFNLLKLIVIFPIFV